MHVASDTWEGHTSGRHIRILLRERSDPLDIIRLIIDAMVEYNCYRPEWVLSHHWRASASVVGGSKNLHRDLKATVPR